jgi:hypothetical protein
MDYNPVVATLHSFKLHLSYRNSKIAVTTSTVQMSSEALSEALSSLGLIFTPCNHAIAILAGAVSGADLGKVTFRTPLAMLALIFSFYKTKNTKSVDAQPFRDFDKVC